MENITFALLLVLSLLYGKDDPKLLGTTEQFVVKSAIIGEEYPIFVYIPQNYNKDSNENQLIVGLDGEYHFERMTKIIAEKVQNGTMPPCIYIGVGNAKKRNRDYTPTAFKHGKGGAVNFYQFLITELMPTVEAKYKIDKANTKTLMGYSFGGLFTHYAMFQKRESNPFNKFIAGGASYWFDSGIVFEYEKQYADAYSDLPVKFFNGMGTLEGGVSLASFAEMNERLESRKYPQFQSKAILVKKSGHSGAFNASYKQGLDYVFTK